jgi:hypothetical protein
MDPSYSIMKANISRYRDGNGVISTLNGKAMPCWRW